MPGLLTLGVLWRLHLGKTSLPDGTVAPHLPLLHPNPRVPGLLTNDVGLVLGPLPPDDLRQRVPGGLACQARHLLAYGESLVEELLDVRFDDHGEDGGRFDASSVVLRDTGVLPGVMSVHLVGGQAARYLVQDPTCTDRSILLLHPHPLLPPLS